MMFREGPKLRAYGFPNSFSCVNGVEDWKVLILIERCIKKWVCAMWARLPKIFAHIVFIVVYEVKRFPWVCKCLLLYCNLQHMWDNCPRKHLLINITFSIWQVGMHQNLDFPLWFIACGVLVHTPKHTFSMVGYSTWEILVYRILCFLSQFTALGRLAGTEVLIFDCRLQHPGYFCTGCQLAFAQMLW